jgi:hypothetical protein
LRKKTDARLGKFLTVILIGTLLISIVYRGIANSKYLPVISGAMSRDAFLTDHLNFRFGDFYDTDGYFKREISDKDAVLLYGFHNLYYVDFPYIHSSWVQRGQRFNYIAVQDGELPERFRYWVMVHYNPVTRVAVYSLGERSWIY